MMSTMKLIEAALFMSTQPVSLEEVARITGLESPKKAFVLIEDFAREFNKSNSALEIVVTHDNKYCMQVKNKYMAKVSHLAVTTDFSKAVLRTLAIVAYKQPIRQSIVVKMRGNKAYDHVNALAEEGFVTKVKESNTYSLETTKKFEEYFGPPVKNIVGQLAPVSHQQRLMQELPGVP